MARQPEVDRAALAGFIARVFPGGGWQAERTAAGVSTPVYRVWRDGETRYLRLAESAAVSLAAGAAGGDRGGLLSARGLLGASWLRRRSGTAGCSRADVGGRKPGAGGTVARWMRAPKARGAGGRLRGRPGARASVTEEGWPMAIDWQHDVAAARERARGERKLVFVDIWSET